MTALTRRAAGVAGERAGAAGPALGRAGRNAAIVVAFLAVYALFAPQVMRSLAPLTGDEPFYVVTALTIWRDHTLDETKSYAERYYDAFYPPDPLPVDWQGWTSFPRDLPPHATHSIRPGLYSKHGLGVALLILPAWVLGARAGAVWLLNLVAALVALNVYLLARRYTRDWRWAAAIAVPLALSNPLMSYAYLIFPEMFAALAIVYAFRRSREGRNNALQWLLVGGCLALLPWLHARFIPAVLGLALALLPGWLRERSWGRRLAAVVPPVLAGLALLAFYQWLYGRPLPNAEDHAGFSDLWGTVNGFFGLFLDEQWGLVIYTPLYLLGLASLAHFWRRRREDFTALLLVVAPYLLLVAFYRVWWGEWGPPARYLAPVAPLIAAPLAAWVADKRPAFAAAALALAALPGLLVMGAFLVAPQIMYNQPDGHSALFTAWAAQLDRPWPKIIPSFQFYALSPLALRLPWSLALAWSIVAPFLGGWTRDAAAPEADDGA
ncbi:MAG TPA: hypothetical protein VFL91_29580 [Thermomicrobiales bacterium]|nr:hypothetical protein [Thermomicrobiales bacterium]